MKNARNLISCHIGSTVTALTPNLVVITWLDCGVTDVKAKEFCLRIQTHYQDCQQSDCALIYFESLTIQKVRIPPQRSRMNKILRPLIVATTLGPHLIITILCWKAITLHLHLKERLKQPEMGESIFDSGCESTSTASTSSNHEHSHTMVPDQALITLEREVTRPTVESDEPILPAAGKNCENQSTPTNNINNITCVRRLCRSPFPKRSEYGKCPKQDL